MVSPTQHIIALLAQCKEQYQDRSDLAPHIEHMIEKLREDAENIKNALNSRKGEKSIAASLIKLHNCVTALRHADTEEKATRKLRATQRALEAASQAWGG